MTPINDDANALPPPPAVLRLPLPLPGADVLGEPLGEFDGTELTTTAAKWRVLLYPDRLRLVPPDGSLPHDVFREEASTRLQFLDPPLMPATLSVKLDKTVPLRLSRDAFNAVENWVGRGELLRAAIKQRISWTLILGALLVGLSFAGRGMAETTGIGARLPFDPYTLGLGAAFLLLWLIARLRPSRWLFAFDSALFFLMAAAMAWRLSHAWGWGSFIVLLLQLLLAVSGARAFRRFHGVSTRVPTPNPLAQN